MILELDARALQGLGEIAIVYNPVNGQLAVPNRSLSTKKEVKWGCEEWLAWHKAMVDKGIRGTWGSKKKFTKAQAIEIANKAFRQNWANSSGYWNSLSCGYTSEFFNYFKSVGLSDMLNIFQAGKNSLVNVASKGITTSENIANSALTTADNVVKSAGNAITDTAEGVSNITGMGKYIVPVIIGGVVLFVGVYAYKNFIKGNERINIPTPGGIVKV